MKIAIFIAILYLIGYARSDVRLSVYTSGDCSDSSRVGFINVPDRYLQSNYRLTGCTPSSDGQFYDIQKGLDAFVLEFSLDWAYALLASFAVVGNDCSKLDETSALTYAVKPGVCMNYGPLSMDDNDNATYSFKATACVNGASDLFFASSFGCSAKATNMQDNTCAVDSVNSIYLGFYCPQPPAAPGASTAPLTAAPAAPTNVPAAVTTPAKASSASLTSFSIAGTAVAVFSYFL